MAEVITGEDAIPRCAWGASSPEYRDYHDTEWGLPVGDDQRILEKLCLEGFQAGLSWLTILRKREAFRRAFAGFDPSVVATYGPGDVERLLTDPGIVRHRGKIEATIANANATLQLEKQRVKLASVLWSHEPVGRRPPKKVGDLPSSTPESQALSAQLRSYGFRFVGATTAYAAMQSLGVVNDHLTGCHFRAVAEAARSSFRRPLP